MVIEYVLGTLKIRAWPGLELSKFIMWIYYYKSHGSSENEYRENPITDSISKNWIPRSSNK